MVSKIKVDEIESSQSGGSIAYNSSMKLKQYTTAQIDALTGMADGEMVYDTDLNAIKYYNSNASVWAKVSSSGGFAATGGSTSTDGSYTLHTFTSSGTFTVTAGSRACNVYVIGGGGSGGTAGGPAGTSSSAGGGGGGMAFKQIS